MKRSLGRGARYAVSHGGAEVGVLSDHFWQAGNQCGGKALVEAGANGGGFASHVRS